MDCVKRSKIPLTNYQKRISYFLSSRKNRSLLVVHPTGYGKTLSAATYSQCFLDNFPEQKVIFIGPASLKQNFIATLRSYGVSDDLIREKYKIYSFQKFTNIFSDMGKAVDPYGKRSDVSRKYTEDINCKNNLVIIDEVHNLRNMSLGSSSSGKNAKAALACVYRAKKILLLTATPFVNDLSDLISLTNLVHGTTIITKRSQIKDVNSFKPYLKGYVDYIKPVFDSNYPKVREETIKIKMEKDYEEDYCKLIRGQITNESVFSNPRAFYNGHRRAVNKVGDGSRYFSQKMKKAISLIGDKKTIIYSNWLEFGLDPICDALDAAGYEYEGFSGRLSESEKNNIVNDFNDDKFQVLVYTPSGKLGLSLIGVRKVIVMEPPWNYANMVQATRRAVRMGSHSHLPKSERVVDIYYLILETSNSEAKSGCLSGDTIVYGVVEKKKEMGEHVDKMLEQISIA